jgi:hypothetical protein
LNCTAASTNPPAVDFVATQFPIPVDTSSVATNCGDLPNNCSQIITQSTQATANSAGSWQPPLPVTIVGSGFGFLPDVPSAVPGSLTQPFPYLNIHNDNNSGQHQPWDTDTNADCQVYIISWTDTSISLVANLQTGLQDAYQIANAPDTYLSPLSDFGPSSFVALAPTIQTGCPVAYQDHLSFTITNPQSEATLTPAPKVLVSSKDASPK